MNEKLKSALLKESESCRVLKDEHAQLKEKCEKRLAELRTEGGKLTAENEVLKAEVKQHVRMKAASQIKLDELRKKLGMTSEEAKSVALVKYGFPEFPNIYAPLRQPLAVPFDPSFEFFIYTCDSMLW